MSVALHHPTVLVVDDDQDTRELYRVILESVGYSVQEASHVAAAAAVLRSCVPDVTLTDWLLPDGSGLGVCDVLQARRASRHVPVVVLSGLVLDDRKAAEARERGCVRFLEKPVDPDAILQAIRSALVIGTERRVRSAAVRARRYARRLFCPSAALASGGDRAQARASKLVARVVQRSSHPVAVMVADDAAHYVAAGGDTRELTGYGPDELAELSVWDLSPARSVAESRGLWRQFIEAGVQEGRYLLRRRNGEAVEAHYCAIANVAPGLHVSVLAAAAEMPGSLVSV
jgi:CheY-like chemotaxis protein